MSSPLGGVSVVVAGAGLAGLTAACDLVALGATVTVVDARDRVGGRVLTLRDGFAGSQHAEAGGDLIDEAHGAVTGLAAEMGLPLTRILRGGWGFVTPDGRGRPRAVRQGIARGWTALARHLRPIVERYQLTEGRWDSPVAADIARHSIAQWLADSEAGEDVRDIAAGLSGFLLADPDALSLLELVEQVAQGGPLQPRATFRIQGGNERLAAALAASLGDRVHLGSELVAVSHRGRGVRVSIRKGRETSPMNSDYLVLALPATLVRRVPITPALPAPQHDALNALRYGRVTRTLLQFTGRFWRAADQPRAFTSTLPFGAAWDGNEEQRGKPGILSLTAGGRAADATRDAVSTAGPGAIVQWLDWLGSGNATLLSCRQFAWDTDPWSRGGYAHVDAAFSPALQPWLARPFGRLFFAGEHTSQRWRGSMNGAVESGRRAAAEVDAVHRSGTLVERR